MSVYPWITAKGEKGDRKPVDAFSGPPGSLIPPGTLKRVGKALMGGNWQSALARELGINPRNFRYMAAGRRAIHAGHVRDLAKMLEAKARTLDHAGAEELRGLARKLRILI